MIEDLVRGNKELVPESGCVQLGAEGLQIQGGK